MALTRPFYDPFRDLMWDTFPRTQTIMDWQPNLMGQGWFQPTLNMNENDKQILVHCELPGVPRENIKLDLVEGALELSGTKEETKEEKEGSHDLILGPFADLFPSSSGDRVIRSECRFGEFHRRIPMPRGTKPENVSAKVCRNFLILCISCP